ncbi:histidine kinase dimerization/phosphoacceptor domain -containing protein [Sphingomicrobium sp. XHP0239]|uniref:histidine kinase dimerization/phosphoacceptor domain -containing protein n=1 Tax=Sphingomicrobium maritimum TaxID=3133972 RepID=UPI0031CC751A
MRAKTHPQQEERLAALRRYEILDTPREKEFDDVVKSVAAMCGTPVSVVNFIDADRQWFKAETGLGVRSTPLDTSLCSHVILENDFVEIPDTLEDPRMSDNPLCTAEDGFRFYAGALLKSADGFPLGTLCVLDRVPRRLTADQRDLMNVLAARVVRELEFRLALRTQEVLRREIDHRVKNSLTMMAAILHLEGKRAKHEETRHAIEAINHRLGSLASLHEEVYRHADGEYIDADKLLERSVEHMRAFVPDNVAIETRVDPVRVSTSNANPIVLIVNEFVSNSGKHGFTEGKGGTITISLDEHEDGSATLTCRDDGSADEDSLRALQGSDGLGQKVTETLARSLGTHAHWSLARPGLALSVGPFHGGASTP